MAVTTTEYDKDDENSLKRKLLIEEILEKRRNSGLFNRIAGFGAFAASIGAFIAAFVALMLANSDSAKQIAEAYEKKAEFYQTKEQLTQIHIETAAKRDEFLKSQTELSILRKQEQDLMRQVKALRDANTGSSKQIVGVDIEISDERGMYYVDVTTNPAMAKASAYLECNEDFVFPSINPSVDKFIEIADRSESVKITPCRFGPFAKMRHHVWIVIDFGNHKEVRFVNLSGS